MRVKRLYLVVSAILLLVLTACAPKSATVSPQAPAAPAATAAAPTPAASTISPEEAAWRQVVEAAKKEGKLVSYSYRFVGDTGERVKQAFKERTGLNVEFITGTGAVLIERIKVERRGGFQVASTLDSGTALLTQAKIEGLTQTIGPLPELQNRDVWKDNPITDKEGHILFSSSVMYSPWVNTRLVKPSEEPKSWRELLQPRWKGKISLPDPDTDPTPVYIYYHLVKKHGILDDAYFRELGKVVVFTPNVRMNAAAVAKGDVDITFASSSSAMSPILQEGAPVKTIDMEEGVVVNRAGLVTLLSQAPHPNAARVFLNWFLSQEGQRTYHEAYGTESIRKDVPNFLHAPARLTPKKVVWVSVEDDVETAKMQRDRVVKNLLLGK